MSPENLLAKKGVVTLAHPVLLDGEEIGYLLQQSGNRIRFEFRKDYWSSPDRKVLGLFFEEQRRVHHTGVKKLPEWFSNLLPEGRLRDLIARSGNAGSLNELDLLLEIGSDLPGAVTVLKDPALVELHGEREAEKTAPSNGKDFPAGLKFSLAGVALKLSVLRTAHKVTIPASDEYGNWIVKFPMVEFPQVPRNEFAMMTLARQVGIDVPECELLRKEQLEGFAPGLWLNAETEAFAIRRFDRTAGGGRIHIEDLTQVRNFYSDMKYTGTYETVGALVYRGTDLESLKEFVRRLVFNLLIGNGDAHLKNFSLIYPDGRTPAISPAYDLVCTAPYMKMRGEVETLGLKLSGSRSFWDVDRAAFQRFAEKLRVEPELILEVVDETLQRFVEQWRTSEVRDMAPAFVRDWIDTHNDTLVSRLSL